MLPLVTEFSIILPEFPRFFKILGGGCDTPPHPPSSDAPDNTPIHSLNCASDLSWDKTLSTYNMKYGSYLSQFQFLIDCP